MNTRYVLHVCSCSVHLDPGTKYWIPQELILGPTKSCDPLLDPSWVLWICWLLTPFGQLTAPTGFNRIDADKKYWPTLSHDKLNYLWLPLEVIFIKALFLVDKVWGKLVVSLTSNGQHMGDEHVLFIPVQNISKYGGSGGQFMYVYKHSYLPSGSISILHKQKQMTPMCIKQINL